MTRLPQISLWVASTILAGVGCKNSKYCDTPGSCGTGSTCDTFKHECVSNVGGAGGGTAGHGGGGGLGGAAGHGGAGGSTPLSCTMVPCMADGGVPVCDQDAGTCVQCLEDTDCKSDGKPSCSNETCVECSKDRDCKSSAKPICTNHACGGCTTNPQCAASYPSAPVCVSGSCVMCGADSDCTSAAATTTTPICGSNICRTCASDAECKNGPQVCMADGHCAVDSEVVFVQWNVTTCPGTKGAGTSTSPYCNPNDAVAKLGMVADAGAPPVSVIVLVGAQGTNMVIGGSQASPVLVIGRAAGADAGSIPALNSTAITVSSGSTTIRDLAVNAGTSAGSKGIAVNGMNTKLTLTNVTVDLETFGGIGIDAETAALLDMKGCTLSNNPGGGILLTNTPFDIEESTFTGNGPATTGAVSWGGIFVNVSGNFNPVPAKLFQDTVTNNKQVGITCTVDISSGSSDVLVATNIGGDVASTCKIVACSAAGASCGVQP